MNARLVLVDDGAPQRTIDLLLKAAARQALTTQVVRASHVVAAELAVLHAGDLLYRPAVSRRARRAEQHLIGPGVVSFYRDFTAPFFDVNDPIAVYAREGLPTVPMVEVTSRRRAALDQAIERCGEFPLVVKVPGGEGGVGVLRADSRSALYSLVDFLLAHRHGIQLMAFIPNGRHIRAVVVGDRVVASYRNLIDPDDFRSTPSRDAADYAATLAPELEALAVKAAHVTGVEFAGVDLLLDEHDTPYVLEANFPCFHAQAEVQAGIPVSDAMIGYLLEKRRRSLVTTS